MEGKILSNPSGRQPEFVNKNAGLDTWQVGPHPALPLLADDLVKLFNWLPPLTNEMLNYPFFISFCED